MDEGVFAKERVRGDAAGSALDFRSITPSLTFRRSLWT